jgi:hypothetical protein
MLNKFKEIREEKLPQSEVLALSQPELHVILSYKVFKHLLARVEKLEAAAGTNAK